MTRFSGLAAGADTFGQADLYWPRRVFDSLQEAALGFLLQITESLDRTGQDDFVTALATCEAVHISAAPGAIGIGAYAIYGLARSGKRAHHLDNLVAM